MLTESDKEIADAARKIANKFDPWATIRPILFAFVCGAISVAALDYGDVWICAGDCNQLLGDDDD